MGYTHYFPQQCDIKPADWEKICRATKALIDWNADPAGGLNIPVAADYDDPDTPPQISNTVIRFNGDGDGGHETFYIQQKRDPADWGFCKTARKPYDLLVVAVLMFCKHYAPYGWDIGSDGDNDDWRNGIITAAAVLAKLDDKAAA